VRIKRVLSIVFLVLISFTGIVVPVQQGYAHFPVEKTPFNHQHNESHPTHHDFYFHVGIFHFLGHVLDDFRIILAESNYQVSLYAIKVKEIIDEQTFDFGSFINTCRETVSYCSNKCQVIKDSFFFLIILNRSLLTNQALRAPPLF